MRKLGVLVIKELKGLITRQVFISLFIVVFVFIFLGNSMRSMFGEIEKENIPSVPAIPQEALASTSDFVSFLADNNIAAFTEDRFSAIDIGSAVNKNNPVVLVFPKGFIENLFSSSSSLRIKVYAYLEAGGGIIGISKISATADKIKRELEEKLRAIIKTKSSKEDSILDMYLNPVTTEEHIVRHTKSARISFSAIIPYIINQTIMLAFLLFIATLTGAQFVAASIAAEKESKTLEVLLTLPIPRHQIVLAKMLAAGILSVIFVAIYFAGFWFYMQSITMPDSQKISSEAVNMMLAVKQLGIELPIWSNIMRIAAFLLSLLNALGIALILGLFAEDTKNVQVVITPIILVLLALYIITIMTNFASLPLVLRIILLFFPFTHAFLSTPLLIDSQYLSVAGGLLYQTIFFAVVVFLAIIIFNSDKVFTIKLGKKKNRKTA
ncbi:ABC transporter permease [Spirochaetia bacterium 38H-sp]|uniref:ABC transporter permease n=1 Tax=Rarispira pelagica TaxID=3141764 RepID=A0ABU9UD61_9SPIR